MLFIELHKLGSIDYAVKVNPGAILFYEPYDKYCRLWIYSGKDSLKLIVKESYEEVNEIINKLEFINESDTLSLHVGIHQYLDFLHSTKQNPLRDEYLRWKGKHKLLSGKKWIDAEELLEHVGRDKLDTREAIFELINKLIIKTQENTDE